MSNSQKAAAISALQSQIGVISSQIATLNQALENNKRLLEENNKKLEEAKAKKASYEQMKNALHVFSISLSSQSSFANDVNSLVDESYTNSTSITLQLQNLSNTLSSLSNSSVSSCVNNHLTKETVTIDKINAKIASLNKEITNIQSQLKTLESQLLAAQKALEAALAMPDDDETSIQTQTGGGGKNTRTIM